VDRSGARGVFLLRGGEDTRQLFEESRGISLGGGVLVEQFVRGLQISTETLMYRGAAHTPGFADRNYEMLETCAPYIIENGGWVPSSATAEQRAAVEELVERAALAIGIRNGVVKGDLVWSKNGPVVIELAARLSGGDFSESLIPLGCGVNIVEQAINVAADRKPSLERLRPRWNKAVLNRYFFPPPGRLVRIEGEAEVRAQPWINKLEFWYEPGESVPRVTSHADRFGVFIVTADTRAEAEERARWVYETVDIVTK
jgi:biotin carboxylase